MRLKQATDDAIHHVTSRGVPLPHSFSYDEVATAANGRRVKQRVQLSLWDNESIFDLVWNLWPARDSTSNRATLNLDNGGILPIGEHEIFIKLQEPERLSIDFRFKAFRALGDLLDFAQPGARFRLHLNQQVPEEACRENPGDAEPIKPFEGLRRTAVYPRLRLKADSEGAQAEGGLFHRQQDKGSTNGSDRLFTRVLRIEETTHRPS
jgi:hypothetical protein